MTRVGSSLDVNRCKTKEFPRKDFYECQIEKPRTIWERVDLINDVKLVWSKNSSSLAVSKKFKFLNADELIEGTGGRLI